MKQYTDIDDLLREAVGSGGTDLHLSVGTSPRMRIRGSMEVMEYPTLMPQKAEELIYPLFDTLARSTLGTQGQYDMAYYLKGVGRFRVNVFKQKGDLAAVFRVLNETVPDYTKLGLPLGLFNLTKKRRGMVLIVGPTGSGKSTTLASFLDIINKNMKKHIITLEDPIEYLHWHNKSIINQREIGKDCDTFANGLRAALREDPDVILIGEMRDLETTDIALTSAETGHLVCSTLHTLGAGDTINRIVDMYPERQQRQVRGQLMSVLEAVVSQQLMPSADGKGYVVAYEIMYKNKEIKEMIRDNDIDVIEEYINSDEAQAEGMVSMDKTIFSKFKEGKITSSTAIDFAFDRRLMQKWVNEYSKTRR